MLNLRGAAGAMTVASGLALGLLSTPALASTAGPPGGDYVFDFSGSCADCTSKNGPQEYGEGVLTLTGVTDLSNLTDSNFVDFAYDSILVGHIDINAVTSFSGDFSDLTKVSVDIESAAWSFTTDTGKGGPSWSLVEAKISHPADYGSAYSWTAASAPEPVSWALMILGFGLAGVQLRRPTRISRARQRADGAI